MATLDTAPTLPVIFRMFRRELCAYFPTERHHGPYITCYAHVGQHGAASPEWLSKGRPAKPDEYADLLQEIRGIYESGDEDHINLKVYRRATGKASTRLAFERKSES